MEDIEYQKKQVDTYKMFLKIREEQAKKEKYKNYSQEGLIDELLEKQEENEQMEATIQSNIKSYNKLAKYSNELEDRIDKAIEYIEQKEISIIYQEFGLHQENVKNELLEILKGEE